MKTCIGMEFKVVKSVKLTPTSFAMEKVEKYN
jgi:hypothetical protein